MTDEEYKILEQLLGKLRMELRHRYCIIPEVLQDGCSIAIYSKKGKLLCSKIGYDIKNTVKLIKKNKI